MNNYFNSLTESEKTDQLSMCRFMNLDEFSNKNFSDKKIKVSNSKIFFKDNLDCCFLFEKRELQLLH